MITVVSTVPARDLRAGAGCCDVVVWVACVFGCFRRVVGSAASLAGGRRCDGGVGCRGVVGAGGGGACGGGVDGSGGWFVGSFGAGRHYEGAGGEAFPDGRERCVYGGASGVAGGLLRGCAGVGCDGVGGRVAGSAVWPVGVGGGGEGVGDRGRAPAGLTWLATDHHNTAQIAVDATTLAATTRRFQPFGEPRGTPPVWGNTRGFLSGTSDPTGLTHLGAREYDPLTGRFISVDPIMDASDPQQWAGYAYANNSPATVSDPAGLISTARTEGGILGTCPSGYCVTRYGYDTWVTVGGQTVCINMQCFSRSDIHDVPAVAAEVEKIHQTSSFHAHTTFGDALLVHNACTALSHACSSDAIGALSSEISYEKIKIGKASGNWMAKEMVDHPELADPGGLTDVVFGIGAIITSAARASRGGGAGGGLHEAGGCSFDPQTPVLMAGGTRKAIKDVQVGDEVLATDPTGGRTNAGMVVATHVNRDDDLIDATLQGGVGTSSVLHTTAKHLVWSPGRGWVKFGDLVPGDFLAGLAGKPVRVLRLVAVPGVETMDDLTIANIHTYYVIAGTTPVLVHNTDACNSRGFSHDSFEDTDYSMDELAGMAYRHSGSGDMHIGGSAPRPTEVEIRTALSRGESSSYGGNSVQYVYRGVRVIINRNMLWQSTAYYMGK
jgi:RHS repeat-associated protein